MNIIVIGGGPGGYTAAIRFAQEGADVTLIEKEHVGGVCLNKGCIPTKLLLHAAAVKSEAENAKEWGVTTGNVSFDWKKVQERKDVTLAQLRGGVEGLLKANGVNTIIGTAAFTAPNQVKVTTTYGSSQLLDFDKCVIATGASDVKPAGMIEDADNVYTGTEILSIKQLPESLIVIGGGVVGCELATAMAQYGVKVTILEYTPQLLNGFDKKQVEVIERRMKVMGIEIHTECEVKSVSDEWGNKLVTYIHDGSEEELNAEAVLLAMGRKPNVDTLCLDAAGVELDGNRIKVDESLQTTNSNVFAIGDCASIIQLEYVATNEAEQLVEYVIKSKSIEKALIPACVYTMPEIARVGTPTEACMVAEFPFAASGRAMSCGCTDGGVKIWAEKDSHKVIAASIVGLNATELISICTLTIKKGMTLEEMGEMVFPHPVLAEGIKEASMMLLGASVNYLSAKK